MSVYSGFATRLLESQYNALLCKLLALLELRVSAALHSNSLENDPWSHSFSTVFSSMQKLEGQKYLPPKFSHYCRGLAQQLYASASPQLSRNVSVSSSGITSSLRKEWSADLYE